MIGQIQTDRPVLVVDDTNSTRYSTVRVLRAAGAEVLEATTGEQALELAPGCGAIVLDVNLPDIDGFEVCRQLRASAMNTRVPVIHLTAQRMRDEDKIRGLEAGADAYLTHPADPGVLVATINALLRARAAEDSEMRSRARFEAMFRTAPVGIALVDATGALLESNAEMLRIFGLESDDGDVWPELQRLVHGILETCGKRCNRDASSVTTTAEIGRTVHLDCRVTSLADEIRLLLVVDVTLRQQLEAEREALLLRERDARQHAEAANRAKDSFLALLSHELRNPLAPISSAAHLLQMAPADEAVVARASGVITRQVGHMKELVDDLMDVSRVTRGLVELEMTPLELGPVLETAVEQVRPMIQARAHAFEINAPEAPVFVSGDRTRLIQVVANLLNNAAKYTPDGGRLRLELGTEEEKAVVRVVDNGVGIPRELLPRVFDLFTQAERTPDRSQGGLGVGLALVKSVVQLHGGKVEASSEGELCGSVFTVRLPLSHAPDEAPAPKTAPEAGAAALGVMLVDDNADAATTLAEVLRMAGHEVRVERDPIAALQVAGSSDAAYDVFVLDIGLPGMSGYELLGQLKSDPRWNHAAFVALTGYGQDSDHELSRVAGFDCHLVKPVTADQLLKSINACVAGNRAG
ncbi:response regulator [Lysobacter korlensis]|uniref:histidine kinase n=1 Tax=Lysobacter korlensis TaxID=553636 RepID=A0ABV6RQZ6_9GAMM